jgi:NAD(P)-dependent dehydrogenase (short-subunit alcohol dehydrogenase family)
LYPIKCDVSKEAEVKSTFNWVKENLGGVDILINNAALGPHSKLIGKKRYMLFFIKATMVIEGLQIKN